MRRWMKALPLALALAALSIVATSCGSSNAQVRFVNAIQNTDTYDPTDITGALNVEFNGTTQFSDVAFPAASASTYRSVPPGSPTIEGLDSANTSTVVFTQTLPASLSAGQEYTMVATGLGGGNGSHVVLEAFPDSNTVVAGNGYVEFRVINASYYGASGTGGAVDVYILPGASDCSTLILGNRLEISNLAYPTSQYNSPSPTNSLEFRGQWLGGVRYSDGNHRSNRQRVIPNFGSQTTEAIRTLVLTDVANGSEMNTALIPGTQFPFLVLDDLN